MTIGSTYDFEQSRDEIIRDALANLGVLAPDESPSNGSMLIHGARALNRVVKSIDPDGMFLWRTIRRTFSTTASTASQSLAADVIAVDDPVSYLPASSTSRSILTQMSRDDYMSIADRTVTGRPTMFWIERALTTATMYLWPVPDTTSDTIEYSAIIRSKDFDTGANTPDFPPEWTCCLVYGLTAELAGPYRQPALLAQYREMFLDEKKRLLNTGGEKGNLIISPFSHGIW